MNRICEQRKGFTENGNKMDASTQNRKERVDISRRNNVESEL